MVYLVVRQCIPGFKRVFYLFSPSLYCYPRRCQQTDVDPIETFRDEVRANFRGVSDISMPHSTDCSQLPLLDPFLPQKLKGPFNESDRLRAGMSKEYYEELEGRPWKYTPASDAEDTKKEIADGDLRIHPRLT